jgi:deoxyribodipyrimidine photo-lyase
MSMAPSKKTAKRKQPSNGAATSNETPAKKTKTSTPVSEPSSSTDSSDPLRQPHPFHRIASENGIVLRDFYPAEMSNARARAYNESRIPRPMETLNEAVAATASTRHGVSVGASVVHWFRMDLRVADNSGLSRASEVARKAGVPVIGLYVISPQDFEAHLRAPARVDFMLRSLEVLRDDLDKLDIPLWVVTVDDRETISDRVLQLLREWGTSHLFANMEYEVDELRRDAKMIQLLADKGVAMDVLHDTCVVPPGMLRSGSGKQYAVYTPWFKAWIHHIHGNLELLELVSPPEKNPKTARDGFGKLFGCKIPAAVEKKALSDEDAKRYRALWPAGEHEAQRRLEKFCEENIGRYADRRNLPAENGGTSSLSVHFASGTLSARCAVRHARSRNGTKRLDGGKEGIQTWISEVAWRDFYRHVLVNWPYIW